MSVSSLIALCVYSRSGVRLFVTRWTVVRQAPLSMGFSRQEYWNGLPFPPPGDHPDPGIEPTSLLSSALVGGFFTPEPPGMYAQSLNCVWLFATPWLYLCPWNFLNLRFKLLTVHSILLTVKKYINGINLMINKPWICTLEYSIEPPGIEYSKVYSMKYIIPCFINHQTYNILKLLYRMLWAISNLSLKFRSIQFMESYNP